MSVEFNPLNDRTLSSPEAIQDSNAKQRTGCFAIVLYSLLISIAAGLLIASILVGGGLGYLVTILFGHRTIPSYIAATIGAFLAVCLSMPSGTLGYFLFFPDPKVGLLTRSLSTLLVAIVGLLFHSFVVMQLAAIVSLGGAYLFYSLEPKLAALSCAVIFPFLGVVFGVGGASPNREG